MREFADVVKQNTPRLVVAYDGQVFKWGVVGSPPTLSIIGTIVRVQAELQFKSADECPERALVIAWEDGVSMWFLHPDIPVDSVTGMLEIIKTTMVAGMVAQQQQRSVIHPGLLGPNGRPII